MFGLSLSTYGMLFGWLIFFLLVWKLKTSVAQALRPRLISLLGATLIITGFFFQPWVKLAFHDYIVPTPDFIKSIAPSEVVTVLLERIGADWLSKFVHIFKMFTMFNGWQTQLIPTFKLGIRVIIIFPLILAILIVFALPICVMFRGSGFSKAFGVFMLVFSLINCILLLYKLPELDSLGIQSYFQWNLLATVLGAHIGNGPWFCIVGLVLTGLGGAFEWSDTPQDDRQAKVGLLDEND